VLANRATNCLQHTGISQAARTSDCSA
jgi:hypothetical protein